MVRRLLVSASMLAVATAVPGGASAASGNPPVPPELDRLPVVSKVAPRALNVGQLLTVTGKHFRPGKLQNQVVFFRPGARPVFALAESSSTTVMRLHLPAKLLNSLPRQDGRPVAARFRVTVMTDRFGPKLLPTARSPLIGPPPATANVPGAADCDGDGIAETARQNVLGLLVVGLRLIGVKALDPQQVDDDPTGTPSQPNVPDVPGVPGAADVPVPTGQMPPESLPPSTPAPDCAAPPAPAQ